MESYATSAQLATWTATAPVNAETLLRSASVLVRRAIMTAIYTTVPAEALADATCAQVAAWSALGIDPAKGSADSGKVVSAKSLGSGSVQYAVYAATAQARAEAATSLCQESLLILAAAGLLGSEVY